MLTYGPSELRQYPNDLYENDIMSAFEHALGLKKAFIFQDEQAVLEDDI